MGVREGARPGERRGDPARAEEIEPAPAARSTSSSLPLTLSLQTPGRCQDRLATLRSWFVHLSWLQVHQDRVSGFAVDLIEIASVSNAANSVAGTRAHLSLV